MKKFEYLVIPTTKDWSGYEWQINECGEEGWELVSVLNDCFYFKREIENNPASIYDSPTYYGQIAKIEGIPV